MRHRVVVLLALASVPVALVGVACGSGSSTGSGDPYGVDSGHQGDDAGSGTGDSGGGGNDSGGGTGDSAASCANVTFKASDNPTCDTCAKDKCCTEVLACQASADCQAFDTCLAACADNDFTCILTCADLHDKGAGIAQELAACAQNNCKAECPLPDAGAGGIDL